MQQQKCMPRATSAVVVVFVLVVASSSWTRVVAQFEPLAATIPPISDSECNKMRSTNVYRPFTLPYQPMTKLPVKSTFCDRNNRCVDYFEIVASVVETQVAQTGPKTKWFGYGSVPGPLIQVCKGRQSIVRIQNNITSTTSISTHLHGAATLSPWDGWAGDRTPYGQAKYYRYPNNRAATLWYHDHDLHNTAFNAYRGLAGMYIVRDCCEDEQYESLLPSGEFEHAIMIADRTISPNRNNELFFELPEEEDDHYGDVILVNGVPWPVMKVQPRTYRFRMLNIGISRTYTLSMDAANTNVPVWLVGTDGGLLHHPVKIQEWTHEVGARYEVVIDFTGLAAGREVVLVNNPMDDFGQDDFCWTHLVMKFVVQAAVPGQTNTPISAAMKLHLNGRYPLQDLVPKAMIDQAVVRARAGQFDKEFLFHRSNGMWKINDRTWDDPVKGHIEGIVRANDVELWKIENGGGGWVHPVHIHLVDFFVVHREKIGLLPYDPYGPKDIVLARPSETTYVLARYGPHSGQWMIHCHNLMHEDNDMMRAFEVSRTNTMAGSVPYAPTKQNEMALSPMADRATPVGSMAPISLKLELFRGWYDVFYPPAQPKTGLLNASNVWEIHYNKRCVQSTMLNPLSPGVTVTPYLNAQEEENNENDGGEIAGFAGVAVQTMAIVGAVAVLVVVVAVAAVVAHRRRQIRQRSIELEMDNFSDTGSIRTVTTDV